MEEDTISNKNTDENLEKFASFKNKKSFLFFVICIFVLSLLTLGLVKTSFRDKKSVIPAQPSPTKTSKIETKFNEMSDELKSAIRTRLFIAVKDKKITPYKPGLSVVYVKDLNSTHNMQKFAEAPSYYDSIDSDVISKDIDLSIFHNYFDKDLNRVDHVSTVMDPDKSKFKYISTNLSSDLLDAIGFNYDENVASLSPDKKKYAFYTQTLGYSEQMYSKFNLQKNKLYILNLETGARNLYDLPEVKTNWVVRKWSKDGKTIYFTKTYNELHAPSHLDGILVFNITDGSARMLSDQQLEYPLTYISNNDTFFGLGHKIDEFGWPVPPGKVFMIDGMTGNVRTLFSSKDKVLSILTSGDTVQIIGAQSPGEQVSMIDRIYILYFKTGLVEATPIQNVPKNDAHWLLSEDNKYLIWKDGSLIKQYDIEHHNESIITDFTKLDSKLGKNVVFNGMVVF
jgi:hypothetical protein